MKGFGGVATVPDDIVEQILIFAPHFSDLLSLILVSKSFYQVFQTHPKSILRCVAYNVTGPALPQALRLLRYEISNRDSSDAAGQQSESDDIVLSPITPKETHELMDNTNLVAAFEDIFSNRYIDRTCITSQLSSQESWNFRRALYRIMLYSRIFNLSNYDLFDEEQTISSGKVQRERLRRESFLSEFDTDELLQIYSLSAFLMDFCAGAIPGFWKDTPSAFTNLALAAGPDVIMECYNEQGPEPLQDTFEVFEDEFEDNPMISEYISYPLLQILEKRKLKPPPSDLSHWQSISTRTGRNELCDQCNLTIGFEGWHKSVWPEVERPHWRYVLVQPWVFLKGNLRHNTHERAYTNLVISSPDSFETVMNEIYDLNFKQDDFSDWTKDDVLCRKCFDKFMIEHLYVWLRHKKLKDGMLKEDCWYGLECRTQVHKPDHAQKLNHLCPNTRPR